MKAVCVIMAQSVMEVERTRSKKKELTVKKRKRHIK